MLRRYRKGLRESRNPSASLAPSRDAEGGCELPWVFWGGKVCSQLRYSAGKVVRQVLNAAGTRPRESPRGRGAAEWRGERGESPTRCLGREMTEGDRPLNSIKRSGM